MQSGHGSVIGVKVGSDFVDLSYFFFQKGSLIVDRFAFVGCKKETAYQHCGSCFCGKIYQPVLMKHEK